MWSSIPLSRSSTPSGNSSGSKTGHGQQVWHATCHESLSAAKRLHRKLSNDGQLSIPGNARMLVLWTPLTIAEGVRLTLNSIIGFFTRFSIPDRARAIVPRAVTTGAAEWQNVQPPGVGEVLVHAGLVVELTSVGLWLTAEVYEDGLHFSQHDSMDAARNAEAAGDGGPADRLQQAH